MRVIDLAAGRVGASITIPGTYDTPIWSPDGQLLAYRFDRSERRLK